MSLRTTGKWLVFLLSSVFASTAAAQAWPDKPIRLIIPLAAGGATDQAARIIASRLGDALGQQIVPENVTGAAGAIALQQVAKARPDGYTIAATANSLHTIAPHISQLSYDAIKSFTMIGSYAAFEYVLVTAATSRLTSIDGLVAQARKSPGAVTFGSSGVGTGNYLAGALLAQQANMQLTAIPYRGGGPAMIDVIAGRTDFMFDVLGGALPQIQSGKVRALGTSAAKRTQLLPNVPPIAESVPGYEAGGWFALIGPAGMPDDIVRKLNAALNRVQEDPDYRRQLAGLGYQPLPGSSEELSKRVKAESEKWKQVVEKLPCDAVPANCK